MTEFVLFGIILAVGVVTFFLLKRKQGKEPGQPTQNYDDKIDRVIEQLDNI